jgi:hypothetical protein
MMMTPRLGARRGERWPVSGSQRQNARRFASCRRQRTTERLLRIEKWPCMPGSPTNHICHTVAETLAKRGRKGGSSFCLSSAYTVDGIFWWQQWLSVSEIHGRKKPRIEWEVRVAKLAACVVGGVLGEGQKRAMTGGNGEETGKRGQKNTITVYDVWYGISRVGVMSLRWLPQTASWVWFNFYT